MIISEIPKAIFEGSDHSLVAKHEVFYYKVLVKIVYILKSFNQIWHHFERFSLSKNPVCFFNQGDNRSNLSWQTYNVWSNRKCTTDLQGSRKRLKVVGAENHIPLIYSEISEFSWVLMDFCGCKTALLKKVLVQLHPLHPYLRDPN